jgi:hypothetical protein
MGDEMSRKSKSRNTADEFKQQQAAALAQARLYHRWTRTMLELMIAEYEEKLVASDLPVAEAGDFWGSADEG